MSTSMGKKDYLLEYLPDLEEFEEKTMKFHNGEMTVAEYKGFSGGFGSYAERGGKTHMLRLRLAGGQVTKERLRFMVETCDKYHIEKMKLTTCQSVQLHHLRAEDLCGMMKEAWKAGMISRGGGAISRAISWLLLSLVCRRMSILMYFLMHRQLGII